MTSPSALRIVQISDTHLSRRRPFFHHNWELLVDLLAAEPCDLIVCSGDMPDGWFWLWVATVWPASRTLRTPSGLALA